MVAQQLRLAGCGYLGSALGGKVLDGNHTTTRGRVRLIRAGVQGREIF